MERAARRPAGAGLCGNGPAPRSPHSGRGRAGARVRAAQVDEREGNRAAGERRLILPEGVYCESTHKTIRRKTRTCWVGPVGVGSDHPIARQTMTTTDTKNVDATVDQVMRCADAGADIVRLTVQGGKEADACHDIREKLFKLGYDTPLVADIHFNPKVALRVAEAFEKIRVNPGNFADGTKKFENFTYETPEEYQLELDNIEEKFTPLVEKCKKLGRAIRIGTNHGSLSARTLSYFGDTPRGMVESAFEFARICRKNDYHNIVFSMKASNPLVMVQAYRLLAAEMYEQDWDYPLHLGVTEAGEGEDGRMKSSIGIGTLLLDGLGDTIRVSLTEDPEFEIEPCSRLAALGMTASDVGLGEERFEEVARDFTSFDRRKGLIPEPSEGSAVKPGNFLHRDGTVFSSLALSDLEDPDKLYADLGTKTVLGLPFKDIATSDAVILSQLPEPNDREKRLCIRRLQEGEVGVVAPLEELERCPVNNVVPLVTSQRLRDAGWDAASVLPAGAGSYVLELDGCESREDAAAVAALSPQPLVLLLATPPGTSRMHASRRLFEHLKSQGVDRCVIHRMSYPDVDRDDIIINGGSQIGALLVDGLGDGVMLEHPSADLEYLRLTSFGMLQGCRMRNTKTEYVSCPSCGRTLFDLQEVTASIQQKTGHLPGVSIAVMGCIVNGPGEMADADFGYVGTVPGKIDLYVGKEVVRRGIPMENAVEELEELIKEHGRWVEPAPAE